MLQFGGFRGGDYPWLGLLRRLILLLLLLLLGGGNNTNRAGIGLSCRGVDMAHDDGRWLPTYRGRSYPLGMHQSGTNLLELFELIIWVLTEAKGELPDLVHTVH